MPWYEFIWDNTNISHIAEHGVSVEEAEHVVRQTSDMRRSRTSKRPIALGLTTNGRMITVVYEEIDLTTAYVITAYDVA